MRFPGHVHPIVESRWRKTGGWREEGSYKNGSNAVARTTKGLGVREGCLHWREKEPDPGSTSVSPFSARSVFCAAGMGERRASGLVPWVGGASLISIRGFSLRTVICLFCLWGGTSSAISSWRYCEEIPLSRCHHQARRRGSDQMDQGLSTPTSPMASSRKVHP